MRIILENESSQAHGRLVLSAGQFMRVGRKAPAELTSGEDSFMSSLHFLIECRAEWCRVSDMGSRNGTFLNGARITDSFLRDGDVITAGQTRFRVQIDLAEKADAPKASSPDFASALGEGTLVLSREPKDLREILCAPLGEHLYAILDAARDDRVLELLRESKERYQSLYEGQQGEDLANFAPYLVELPKGSPLLDILIKEGWGKSWGIYLTSAKPLEEVRKHFRHFLIVQTEDGKELYFRFYDPRVLRNFLPICTKNESNHFFGPVRAFTVETRHNEVVNFFNSRNPNSLDPKSFSTKELITSAQYEALGQRAADTFSDNLATHLRQHFPDKCRDLGEMRLKTRIGEGIRQAAVYCMTSEVDVSQYIWLTFAAGFNFDRDPVMPWAREILMSFDLDPEIRMGLILDRLQFERTGAGINE